MSTQFIFDKLNVDSQKAIDHLKIEFSKIRAGRANPQLFDRIMVEYYGAPTSLNQMANISVPEPRQVLISVWDAGALKDVEKAIINSDLGLTPNNDGKVIRVNFPILTEERRKDIVKQMKQMLENVKVTLRNERRDALEAIKKFKKENSMSDDELKILEAQVDKVTQKFIDSADAVFKDKEKEVLTV